MPATFGGSAVLGTAVRCPWSKNPSEQQINAFFGVDGLFSLFGGQRGRVFPIEGVFLGVTFADIMIQATTLETYDDGRARTLTLEDSSVWNNVVYTGQFQWTAPYQAAPGGWARPFACAFRGNL